MFDTTSNIGSQFVGRVRQRHSRLFSVSRTAGVSESFHSSVR